MRPINKQNSNSWRNKNLIILSTISAHEYEYISKTRQNDRASRAAEKKTQNGLNSRGI